METTVSFGYWIRRQRKALDLTQQVLAERVGCSLAAIKKIESDERRPSRQIAERMAEVLGVPASQREIFLECARGIRSVDQLLLAHEPTVSTPLPTGIVTFLFTDIEGSTKHWEGTPEQMKLALQRHHAILQEAISSNGGNAFQIVGDAFYAAFPTTLSAISAAVTAQRGLHQEPWDLPFPIRVRMGIHTGEAEQSSKDSPTGGYASNPTLNRVARILNAGHGGQILLSLVTKELVKESLPANTELRDMGEHYLKYLIRPEHLFQLNIDGLPADFPPLNALDFARHNLPIQLTSFIGREKEIEDVIHLLEKARMVTLIGPGGTGKTRLSIQVANELLDQYPNGIWWVELASLMDEALVPQAVAKAVGVQEFPNQSLSETLANFLHSKQVLLVLDNCEHLIAACAQLAELLLRRCPNLKVLATSREALEIAGESVRQVPTLLEDEGIRLFVERAGAIKSDFTMTEQNVLAIAQICQRLDAIPLAIELAAARVKALTVEQIAARLDDRFNLLTSGSRTALPRHQTLRAAINWSYDLLTDKEQLLFRRLAVFVGGWTLEAVESVCDNGEGGLQLTEILDLLARLVDKSLVLTEDVNGGVRYHCLDTIRQYAQDKYLGSEDVNGMRNRHLMWYLHQAEMIEPKLEGGEQDSWNRILETEHDNMRAALQWALKKNEDAAVRLAGTLGWFWIQRSFLAEGRNWLEAALASGKSASSVLKIRAQTFAAGIAVWQGDAMKATSLARAMLQVEKSLSASEDDENTLMMIRALFRIGLAISLGENIPERAISIFRKARVLAKKADDLEIIAASLLLEGNIYISERRFKEAKNLHEQALFISQAAQTQTTSSVTLYCLIGLALLRGDIAEAETYQKTLKEHLTTFSLLGNLWISHGTEMEGRLRVAENDLAGAQALLVESLRTWQEAHVTRCISHGLEACASLALAREQMRKAVKLLGASEALHMPKYPIERVLYEHTVASVREKLDQPVFGKGWAEGSAMTMEQAIGYALGTDDE